MASAEKLAERWMQSLYLRSWVARHGEGVFHPADDTAAVWLPPGFWWAPDLWTSQRN